MAASQSTDNSLRDALREGHESSRQLERLSLLFPKLEKSRRWRVADALGRFSERLRLRPSRPKLLDEIERILRPYRRAPVRVQAAPSPADPRERFLQELCQQIPRLLNTRRWRVGRAVLRPARVLLLRVEQPPEARLLAAVRQGRRLLAEKRRRLDHRANLVLDEIEHQVQRVLSSGEWRTGRRIGDAFERLGRRGGEKSVDRILATLEAYSAWRASLPGVTQRQDRDRFDARYQRYLSRVEPVLRARDGDVDVRQVSIRSVVLAGGEPTLRDLLGSETGDRGDDWVVFVAPTDRLSDDLPRALAGWLATSESVAAVVFDHDRIDASGRRTDPTFKPGFSPELLIEQDYVGRAVAFSRRHLLDLDDLSSPPQDLVRAALWRLFVAGEPIGKIDRVLLHETASTAPTSQPASDTRFASWALEQRDLRERVEVEQLPYGVRVRPRCCESALVSIIITFTDKVELLRQCVESIRRLTTHRHVELVLVDSRSCEPATAEYLAALREDPKVKLIRLDETFNFSRANNRGALVADGEFLVFLNNDTKLVTPDWLQQLCGYASLDDIGAVGAKLLFPDGSIQHAGVVVGMKGSAAHPHARQHEPFVPSMWIAHARDCSAVTGACLAIERRKFLAGGGFDERLTLTGNDVELCLRLGRQGLRNVFIPSVVLVHYEKSTRCEQPVTAHNRRFSLYTYREILRRGDPFYNSGLALDTTELVPRTEPPEIRPVRASDDASMTVMDASRRFLSLYDLSRHELAANRERIESFRRDRRVVPQTITWFVPHFDHVYRGGIYTVMRIADAFTRRCGALNRFVFYGRGGGDLPRMGAQIATAFPTMRQELLLLPPSMPEAELPESDLAFCTLWTSAYHLARYNQCRGKLYLVQDFEGGFSRDDSVYALAEQSYRLGFPGIANTPGVGEMYRSYGNEAESFVPSVDREIFYPADLRLPDDVFRVVVYGRPSKPRNAFALAAESLRELKRRHGERVEILSAGEEFNVGEYGLDGVLVNLGVLPDMHAVASLYRHSHAGLVFMLSKHPSYQPFEYMASGCAVVTNDNESNRWFLRDRENCLAVPPLRTRVVEGLEELMEDEELRGRLISGGRRSLAVTEWEQELDFVYRFVTTGEQRGSASLSLVDSVAAKRMLP